MNLNSHENRAFRQAKLEQTITETSTNYKYDGNGEVEIDDVTGEPIMVEESRSHKVFIPFRYNMMSQAQIQKIQYIANVWNQDCIFTIKTYDPIDPKSTDRVVINDQVYTIDNIYKEFNDSTAGMFNTGGYCITYIGLKGAVSL